MTYTSSLLLCPSDNVSSGPLPYIDYDVLIRRKHKSISIHPKYRTNANLLKSAHINAGFRILFQSLRKMMKLNTSIIDKVGNTIKYGNRNGISPLKYYHECHLC